MQDTQNTTIEAMMEQMTQSGPETKAKVFGKPFNLAMKIERDVSSDNYLGRLGDNCDDGTKRYFTGYFVIT